MNIKHDLYLGKLDEAQRDGIIVQRGDSTSNPSKEGRLSHPLTLSLEL